MEQKIIPTTSEDFQAWDMKIRNNDKFCPYCNGELETNNKALFSAGIVYVCRQCEKRFKKTNYRSFGWGEDYFILKEEKE